MNVTIQQLKDLRESENKVAMSDEETLKILSEREPDFSATTHPVLSINELDSKAIKVLKEKYAQKSGNPSIQTLSTKQVLSDLELIKGEKVTYAALILLGKKDAIRSYLPNASISLEYRLNESAIQFDDRKFFNGAYLLAVEELWATINLRNSKRAVRQGAYMVDIPFFNEDVIREALNNAVVHRDYTNEGEILIKQSTEKIEFANPGGFPYGVNKSNILTVNSTPRNRLLADILLKIGLVERSGQGVDKMFLNA